GAPVFREINGTLMVAGVVAWSTGPKLSEGCGGLTGVPPPARYRAWVGEQAARVGSGGGRWITSSVSANNPKERRTPRLRKNFSIATIPAGAPAYVAHPSNARACSLPFGKAHMPNARVRN